MNTLSYLYKTIPTPPGVIRINLQFNSYEELLHALGSLKIHGRTIESRHIYQGHSSKKRFEPDLRGFFIRLTVLFI